MNSFIFVSLCSFISLHFFLSSSFSIPAITGVCPYEKLVQRPIPRPSEDYSLDPERLKSWVNAHPQNARRAAQFNADHIRHVSQAELEMKLEQLVKGLIQDPAISDLPKLSFVLPKKLGSSERWVTALAVEKLLASHPEYKSRIEFVDLGLVQDLSSYKELILIDDAVFSGTNLYGTALSTYNKGFTGRLHVGVALGTSAGQDFIKATPPLDKYSIQVHIQEHISSVKDLLEQLPRNAETDQLKKEMELNYIVNSSAALVYLDSKIPSGGASSLIDKNLGDVLLGSVPTVDGKDRHIVFYKNGKIPESPYRNFIFP